MPRIAPITGKSDVPEEHHAVVDAVVGVFDSEAAARQAVAETTAVALEVAQMVEGTVGRPLLAQGAELRQARLQRLGVGGADRHVP